MSVFSHLDKDQVMRAVQALCMSLDEGGLLVLGRNPGRHSDRFPTTIFRREAERLVPIVDVMGGSDERATALEIVLVPLGAPA